jgi:TonB family protein
MHFLLTEVSMSRFRLLSSYLSITAILALAGWTVVVSFPLVGQAGARPALPPASQTPQQSPGYVVNQPPYFYPPEALQKRIEGTVVVELTFNVNGEIVDSRVLSGPEELRRAGLESALKGTYKIDVARTLQVVVDFKLPPAGPRGAGPRGIAGVPPAAPPLGLGPRGGGPLTIGPGGMPSLPDSFFNNLGLLESIEIRGLEGSDLALMQQRLQPYQGKPMSVDLVKQINEAIRSAGVSTPRTSTNFAPTANNNTNLVLTFSTTAAPVRVGGNVAAANLIHSVEPVYPPLARQARIQGVVVLEVDITKDGKVGNLRVITGHPLLIQAAIDAVKQWEYTPLQLNGEAVEVVAPVTVNFVLPPQ